VAAGVILAFRRPDEERAALAPRRVGVAVIGLVVVLALLAASEGRRWEGEYYLALSGSELNRDADGALRDAGHALDLNPDSLPAHYAAARAYAATDRYELARATLLDAARKEPSDYVPWVLLGDLAVRHGRLGQARVAYRRATARSPYDTDFSVSNSLEQLRGG
jgi:cytochrome c-type biogenesis protein CcmH/NrfG